MTAFADQFAPEEPEEPQAGAPADGQDFALTFSPREADLVQRSYAQSENILEYGSGGSTILAAQLGKPIVSVESDRAWADRLAARLAGISASATIHHVDIGPTRDWGHPLTTERAARYHRYALSVWDRPDLGAPDLVLIDGRFRAACLAATLMRTRGPVRVLFDDYVGRRFYHRVEALATLEETVGRMAVFTVVPGTIPAEILTEVIGWFSDPR